MSDTTAPLPASKRERKKRNLIIAAVAVIVVIALAAVAILGGFLGGGNDKDLNALESIKKRGKMIVGISVPWEPFEVYNTTSGEYEGFDIDVITQIAQILGVGVEFRPMDFDVLLGAVKNRQVDVVISAMPINADRSVSVNFSAPYYTADQAVLVRDDSSITGIDGLNGTMIAAKRQTTSSYWIEDHLAATLVGYDSIIDTVLAVENGQDDVQSAMLDSPLADRYASDPSYHLKVAAVIPDDVQYGVACPENEPELVAAINGAISTMYEDGSLEALLDQWA